MMKTKQTFEDYKKHVIEITAEYEAKEKNYGWKANSYHETLGGTHYYYMTNRFQTTKITYIMEAKIMDVNHIYSKDLDIINKLKESL